MPPKIVSGAKRLILGLREKHVELSSDQDGVLTRGSKSAPCVALTWGIFCLRGIIMKKTSFLTLSKAKEITQTIPTPFHIYDEAGIRANARALKAAFSWNKGFREYFAVKATPNPYIMQILKEEGIGADCSSYQELAFVDRGRPELSEDIIEQVNIEIKYDGYIKRQKKQVLQFAKMEKMAIPNDIDYDDVKSLRIEARQKLKEFKPSSIGQASRVAGVSPADVNVLLVYLKQNKM